MRYNRHERKLHKEAAVAEAMSGSGLYIYENRNEIGDLTLPKPTKTGMRIIGPKGKFQGDDYYMQYVRSGILRLIEILEPPVSNDTPVEEVIVEQKLILDQPETVTASGQVEHVVENPAKVLSEDTGKKKAKKSPVLLNEGPVGSVELV